MFSREQEEINPEYSYDYLDWGLQYKKLGLYSEAMACFNKAIALDGDNSTAYLVRSKIYNHQQDVIAAIDDLEMVLKLSPIGMFDEGNGIDSADFAIALCDLGKIYLDQGSLSLAINHLKRALDLYRRDQKLVTPSLAYAAYKALARTYRLKGLLDLAILNYRLAIEMGFATDAEDYYLRGIVHLSNRNQVMALEDFSKSILIGNSEQAPPFVYRACTYLLQGKLFLAKDDFERALELDPECDIAHLYLAKAYLTANSYEKAMTSFEKVWLMEKGSLVLRVYAALQFNKLSSVAMRIDLMKVVAELKRQRPKMAEDYCVLALAYISLGKHREAASSCSILFNPEYFMPNAVPLYLQEDYMVMFLNADCWTFSRERLGSHISKQEVRGQLIEMMLSIKNVEVQINAVLQTFFNTSLLGVIFERKDAPYDRKIARDLDDKIREERVSGVRIYESTKEVIQNQWRLVPESQYCFEGAFPDLYRLIEPSVKNNRFNFFNHRVNHSSDVEEHDQDNRLIASMR